LGPVVEEVDNLCEAIHLLMRPEDSRIAGVHDSAPAVVPRPARARWRGGGGTDRL